MVLALFDLDGTLIDAPSCECRFLIHLAARGRLGGAQLAAAAGFTLRRAPRHGHLVFKRNKAYLRGLAVDEVEAMAADFTARQLVPRLRPSIVDRLERHRQKGDAVALLSGAPSFIVGPMAEALGVETWRAARFAAADGRFLAAPPAAHPFGAAKLGHAEEICAALGTNLAACIAYADSGHDLALLQRAGRAVAVTPDRALARAARRHGWECLAGEEGRPGKALAMSWRWSG